MSQPRTFRQTILRAIRTSVLCMLPFLVLPFLPTTQQVTSPEHGAAATSISQKQERQYERAMAKCQALPANTLPGAAVVGRTDGSVSYTNDAEGVDLAFQIALGELTDPAVSGVTLCR